MTATTQHLRHAARRLARSPSFMIAAAITLALGFASTATIFTVVNRILLRPLPYPDAHELVWVDHVAPGIQLPGSPGLSQGLFKHYRERARTIVDLAIWQREDWTLTGAGTPERITGVVATASLGDALRAPPLLGRWYTEQEAQDRTPVVVLGEALWANRFGADRDIIGRTVHLNGTAREVVGVVAARFSFPDAGVQLYVPERLDEEQTRTTGGFNYQSVARLAAGVTVADVKREIDGLIAGLEEAFPGDPITVEVVRSARLAAALAPLKDHLIAPVRRMMWLLLGMVGLVLLIAGANVANLFLVRAEERQRDVAVRRALGAGRGGVIAYFLAESALLATAAGAVAFALTAGAVRLLVRYGPGNLPRLGEVAVDGATASWVAALVVLASIVFATVPLLRRGGVLTSALREGGRGATAGRTHFRVRNVLMGGQVALALVLLVASGLMLRSFLRLRAVDPGFVAENVLTFDVSLARREFPDREAALRFHEALLERIHALPGVVSASAVGCLPLTGSCWGDPLRVRGRTVRQGELPPVIQFRRTLPGYFETMRIPVLRGRTLEPADHRQRAGVIVLSARAAQLYFPDVDPLGKQVGFMFQPGDADDVWYTVVGVVGDTRVESLDEGPYGIAYLPPLDPVDSGNSVHTIAFVVRTRVPPMSLVSTVRRAAAELSPSVALGHIRRMDTIVAASSARTSFTLLLLLIAGSIALVLGAVGIYGVISYVVGQRRNEIGVRMALGARPADVSTMVLKQGGAVVGAGIAAGVAGAFLLSRVLSSLLFGVSPSDTLTYAVVTLFLGSIAALATWLPARRAAATDPAIALRAD
jgi:putative ABC transport system permease protein